MLGGDRRKRGVTSWSSNIRAPRLQRRFVCFRDVHSKVLKLSPITIRRCYEYAENFFFHSRTTSLLEGNSNSRNEGGLVN